MIFSSTVELRAGLGAAALPWMRARALAVAMLLALAAVALTAAPPAGIAQERAEAAKGPPVSIALFVSSRTDMCFDPGDVAAVRALAQREQERINRQGGMGGRPLQVRVFDDQRDAQRLIGNLRTALADPLTIAMVGVGNSNMAKAAFDAVGKEIGDSRIPLLSHIAVNSIFRPHTNVFTTQSSQDEERVPVMAAFIQHLQLARLAFVGRGDAVFSTSLGDALRKALGADRFVSDHRLAVKDDKLDTVAVADVVLDLRQKQAEMAILAVGGPRTATLMKAMMDAAVTPALFVTGRIDALPSEIVDAYPNAIYQLAWDSPPEASSERLRRLIEADAAEAWIFEGARIAAAPGWTKGECKPRPPADRRDPLEEANLRAIATGARYADMVGLVAAALRTAPAGAEIQDLRRQVLRQLETAFAAGRGAYRGSFGNWSFQKESRAAVRTPFVVIQPQGLGRTQLAPVQFVRIRSGALRKIETLYADIDLVRAHRVEDNEKTFFAEFYLSMRNGRSASIEQIEFTNAYLDPKTNGRQITVEVLHDGGPSDVYPDTMKIYKVAGRFIFEPDLSSYPFDTQRFSIDIQPRRGDVPFIVQAPPLEVRDKSVATDGWDARTQYVGYDDDFIPSIDAYTHAQSVAPFYKASYVWLMQRQTTDYFLRVVVPLGFIIIVAYLSIFIPHSHFEAIVTIQVTALLSAVALYLSLPQLGSDTATVSDQIFVFTYMIVSLMIVLSILRVNRMVAVRSWLKGALGLLHVVAIPMMVLAMGWFIETLRSAGQ